MEDWKLGATAAPARHYSAQFDALGERHQERAATRIGPPRTIAHLTEAIREPPEFLSFARRGERVRLNQSLDRRIAVDRCRPVVHALATRRLG